MTPADAQRLRATVAALTEANNRLDDAIDVDVRLHRPHLESVKHGATRVWAVRLCAAS